MAIPVAGSGLYISADLPATYDEAGFEALTTLTLIKDTTDLGTFGRTYSWIEFIPTASRQTQYIKGNFTEGTPTIAIARDATDPGQQLAETARDDDAEYSFALIDGQGNALYWQGLVGSFDYQYGASGAIIGSNMSLAINHPILAVAA